MKTIVLLLLAISLVTVLPAMSQDAKYWLAQTQSDYNNGTYLQALDDIEEYLNYQLQRSMGLELSRPTS